MTDSTHRARRGTLLALMAIFFWSTSSSLYFWGGTRCGWQFLAVACGIGGVAQLVCYRLMNRSMRSLLMPPARLALPIALGFVIYMPLYFWAISSAAPGQAVGVSLINYLWPTLTVVLSVILVPLTRVSVRLALGVALSLAALAVANWQQVQEAFAGVPCPGGAADSPSAWPYLAAAVAALAWAAYCAVLSRWKHWADAYATAPLGFLAVAAISLTICWRTGRWSAMTPAQWAAAVFAGLGPSGAGYMLWELAIHRGRAEVLGLLGGATPILSTAWLWVMFAFFPTGEPVQQAYLRQMIAASMIAAAVLLAGGKARSREETTAGRRDAEVTERRRVIK